MTRIYIGTAAQLLGTGALIGVLLGWMLTRWYFVGILRRIHRRVGKTLSGTISTASSPSDAVTIRNVTGGDGQIVTELRRRKDV